RTRSCARREPGSSRRSRRNRGVYASSPWKTSTAIASTSTAIEPAQLHHGNMDILRSSGVALLLATLTLSTGAAQLMSPCAANSPERRGELGCSIIEERLLPTGTKEPLYWHIDRFDSERRANAAIDSASVAFAAAGTSWLITVESQTLNHH